MTGAERVQELVDEAAALLRLKGTAMTMLRDTEDKLAAVRDRLVAAGCQAGDEFDVPDGEVVIEPGKVRVKRSVRTDWLAEHFEDLPAEVRVKIDRREVAVVDLAVVPDSRTADLLRELGDVQQREKWPTVADLEAALPEDVLAEATTAQERGEPTLAWRQRGMSVGQGA